MLNITGKEQNLTLLLKERRLSLVREKSENVTVKSETKKSDEDSSQPASSRVLTQRQKRIEKINSLPPLNIVDIKNDHFLEHNSSNRSHVEINSVSKAGGPEIIIDKSDLRKVYINSPKQPASAIFRRIDDNNQQLSPDNPHGKSQFMLDFNSKSPNNIPPQMQSDPKNLPQYPRRRSISSQQQFFGNNTQQKLKKQPDIVLETSNHQLSITHIAHSQTPNTRSLQTTIQPRRSNGSLQWQNKNDCDSNIGIQNRHMVSPFNGSNDKRGANMTPRNAFYDNNNMSVQGYDIESNYGGGNNQVGGTSHVGYNVSPTPLKRKMTTISSSIQQQLYINENISNMDVGTVNRNTRFFKSYLKDQYKAKQEKKRLNHKVERVKKAEKGDPTSLSSMIQSVTVQPLKRHIKQGEDGPSQNQPKQMKSEKDLKLQHNKTFKSGKDQKLLKLNDSKFQNDSQSKNNFSGDLLSDSFVFTSQMDEQNGSPEVNKIERKSKHVEQQKRLLAYINTSLEADDTLSEEEIKRIDHMKQPINFIIYPDSNFRTGVDSLSFLIILAISLYIPFVFSFNIDTTTKKLRSFENFIDIYFILEIILNFNTGIVVKSQLVMDRKIISWKYFTTWFFIDVISSFPYSFLDMGSSSSGNISALKSAKLIRILRLIKYARLLRLLRFLKVNKLVQGLEDLIVSDIINIAMEFIKLTVILFFITHWMACIFFSVADYNSLIDSNNWIQSSNLQDASVAEKYVSSLYWAFTTMTSVGYGDIHPYTSAERVITILCMIISSGVYAYIIGDVGKIVTSFNVLAAQFRERMLYVEQFLRRKDIPPELRIQVKRYLEYNWELKKQYKIEEHEMLNLLNDNLKGKITVYLNGKILQNIEVLSKFPIEFLSNVSFILKKKTYAIDENLLIEGDNGDEIFFIVSGRVAIIHKLTKTHIRDLHKDQYFGEIGFFTQMPRQTTIKSCEFTDVLTFCREDFLSMAFKVSEQALILYHKIASSVDPLAPIRDYKKLGVRCYVCEQAGHISIECKQFNRTLKGNLKRFLKKFYNINMETDKSLQQEEHNPVESSFKEKESFLSKLSRGLTKTVKKQKSMFKDAETPYFRNENSKVRDMTAQIKRQNIRHSDKSYSNIIALPLISDADLIKGKEEDYHDEIFREEKDEILQEFNTFKTFKYESSPRKSEINAPNIHNSKSLTEKQISDIDEPQKQINPNIETPVIKAKTKKIVSSTNLREIIQEEVNEDELFEDDLSVFESNDDKKELTKPLLQQSYGKNLGKPPKTQNELTRIIGKKKRFSSKEFRNGLTKPNTFVPKRSVKINHIGDAKNTVQTVVEKTFTTFVHMYTKKKIQYQDENKRSSTQQFKSNYQQQKSDKKNSQKDEKQSFYMNMFDLKQNTEQINKDQSQKVQRGQQRQMASPQKKSNQRGLQNSNIDRSDISSLEERTVRRSDDSPQKNSRAENIAALGLGQKLTSKFFTETESIQKTVIKDHNLNKEVKMENINRLKDHWEEYEEDEGNQQFQFQEKQPQLKSQKSKLSKLYKKTFTSKEHQKYDNQQILSDGLTSSLVFDEFSEGEMHNLRGLAPSVTYNSVKTSSKNAKKQSSKTNHKDNDH